jgi:hypothetical protein
VVGAALGLAVGVTVALSHLNVPGLILFGFALTPSVSGLLLGSTAGLLIGLTVGFTRRPGGPSG